MSPELILPLGTISPWPDGGTAYSAPGCDASPSLGCPSGMSVVFYMNRSFNCKEVDLKNKRLKTPEIQIILVRESALSHLDDTGLKSTQLMLYHA